MTSLETLVNLLLVDVGNQVDFGALTGLLQVVPDQVLATAGRAVAQAGIDAAFVAKLDQLALDVALLQDAERQTLLEEENEGPNPFLEGGTKCTFYNANRPGLKAAAGSVLGIGAATKLVGYGLIAAAKTVRTDKEIAIHGYVGLQIKTDIKSAIGKVLNGIGDVTVTSAGSGFLNLRHCEVVHYQRVILNEICTLNRGRSSQCINWNASDEAQDFQP